MLRNWSVVSLIALLLLACEQSPRGDALREGQRFPPLTLYGLDRADVAIDDLRGHWLIVNVWATWCGPCRQELGSLQQLSERFPAGELLVLGLNVDADIHIAREFMRDQALTFANYSDPKMRIARTILGIRAYPDTFIIAPDGTLWRSISGERDWNSDAVVAVLTQAIAGRPEGLAGL
jgi:peroxiredoxin